MDGLRKSIKTGSGFRVLGPCRCPRFAVPACRGSGFRFQENQLSGSELFHSVVGFDQGEGVTAVTCLSDLGDGFSLGK